MSNGTRLSQDIEITGNECNSPTLTIVALALRQADHISSEMGKGNL